MQTFHCDTCHQPVYLRNNWCTHCAAPIGFAPDQWAFVNLAAASAPENSPHRLCANSAQGLCNWLLPEGDTHDRCPCCLLTEIWPVLDGPQSSAHLFGVELAKRRLLMSLKELGLPVFPQETRVPLRFAILADLPGQTPVKTGHAQGLITLNMKEADPTRRMAEQQRFAEPQRTVLGHLRHESGHFYWDEWVATDPSTQESFRALFGDERADYAQALQSHHASPQRWDPLQPNGFISSYAQAHPWEDWAETWAHFLLMADALSEVSPDRLSGELVRASPIDTLLDRWVELSVQSNAINRSIGLPDAYPFVLDELIRAKLDFVRSIVLSQAWAR
jgi:hypothetical protein